MAVSELGLALTRDDRRAAFIDAARLRWHEAGNTAYKAALAEGWAPDEAHELALAAHNLAAMIAMTWFEIQEARADRQAKRESRALTDELARQYRERAAASTPTGAIAAATCPIAHRIANRAPRARRLVRRSRSRSPARPSADDPERPLAALPVGGAWQ